MDESFGVDVLLPTLNGRDRALDCLGTLQAQDVAHRVYVADNGGNADGTSDAIRAAFPDVQLLTSQQNLGFGRAVNRLASLGKGEALVVLNDDMMLEPTFLRALIAPLRSDPRVGMVAAMTLQPGDPVRVDGFGIEVDAALLAFNRLRHRDPSEVPGRLLGPSGGAAAYRRSAWEESDGLDERIFFYAEDEDLALRLRGAGWIAAAAEDARALHLGGASAGTDSPFQRFHAGFGRGFLLRRYGVLRSRAAPRALVVELLTVLYGAAQGRTLVPLRGRVAGWRAAKGAQLPIPADAVDDSITLRETLRRLRCAR